MNEATITIREEELKLLPEKAIFWPRERVLMLSDLHLGKAGHFRKHGIPVSGKVHDDDLDTLQKLINQWQPNTVALLGDLFHSSHNNEWESFERLIRQNHSVEFVLVKGNHDILSGYPDQLLVVDDLEIAPFSLSHMQMETKTYNLSGHIHPGVRVYGKARQSMTLPCFWFGKEAAVLPAFGGFTGLKRINPSKSDRVFGITTGKVVELCQ